MVVPAHKTLDEMAAGICGNRPARCLRASISDISQDATLHPTSGCTISSSVHSSACCFSMAYRANAVKRPPDFSLSRVLEMHQSV
mmetsp:Transcript_144742/g.204744  ORF Transcript_144742/g.204744 Transcript_144742/m.204744 type:complete len:85 (-) Transcript_144742:443-697(-)